MKEILLTSSVLILAIVLLRRIFRNRVSHRFQYALWALVALRLLIPVQFGEFQFSVSTMTRDSAPIAAIEAQVSQPLAKPDYQAVYAQVSQEFATQGYDISVPQIKVQIAEETTQRISLPTWGEILQFVWLAGIGAMAVWFGVVNLRFRRTAKKGAVRLEIDSPVPVYVSDTVTTPCLTGLLRPVIYLTPACAGDERLRRHVLTHELTHYRHGDHIWALVRCVCLCVYWFDPLVWLAAALERRDCELACDEGALKCLGENERLGYGRTLLDVVAGSLSPSHLLETATAMNESKRQLKERVDYIVKKPRFYAITAVCLILVIALVAGCTFTGKTPEKEEGNEEYLLLESLTQYYTDNFSPNWVRYIYDENDHLTKVEEMDNDGMLQTSIVECDENGKEVARRTYNQDSQLVVTETREYDSNGNLIRQTSTQDEEVVQLTEYTYDDNGRELTRTATLFGTITRIEILRDSEGKPVWQNSYADGALSRRSQFTYDEAGNNTAITWYDGSGSKTGWMESIRDESTGCTKSTIYNADGTIQQTSETWHDEAGNLLKQESYQSSGELLAVITNTYKKVGEESHYPLTTTPEESTDPAPTDDDVPEPTGCQPVPENYSANTMVTTWKEVHLEWESGGNYTEYFDARIPTLYPFSNDAIAINQQIMEKYGTMVEENQRAAEEGYSAYPVSIDYKVYTTSKTLSLVIIVNTGFDYIDYEVYNFYLERGEFAVTMDTAAMARYFLDISYPEFLYAATKFSTDAFYSMYGELNSEMMEDFLEGYKDIFGTEIDGNTVYMLSYDLYTDENSQLMLKFNCISMAGADSYPTIRYFDPIDTNVEESYDWLFNLKTDGAYTEAYATLLARAYHADSEEFTAELSKQPQDVIDHINALLAP